ncbi:MAG TPA: hypothetical protein VN675_05900 [Burkholderiales bacterium]|nr:hypothetical protein [Burkholderiales bacterium]
MKRRIPAGLIVISAWSIAFVIVAAAASICSSCGVTPATRVSCAAVR